MRKNIIVITGASFGIGAATAKAFSEAGYEVVLLARSLQAMEDFKLAHAHCFAVDVSDQLQLQKTLTEIEESIGPIDCLINNAGYAVRGNFTDSTPNKNKAMIEINFLAVINAIDTVIPNMRARNTGTIINISSVDEKSVRSDIAVYSATKAAVLQLSKNLRSEYAQHNIRICTVAPSLIDTPMLKELGYDASKAIGVEHMAKAILWIYQQPQEICVRDMTYAPTSIPD